MSTYEGLNRSPYYNDGVTHYEALPEQYWQYQEINLQNMNDQQSDYENIPPST